MRTAALGSVVVWTLAVLIAAEVKDAPKGPSFSCRGRSPGYYADLETNCQDYHMCDAGGRRYTYSCPNQTRFQQRVMICDHYFMVDCSLSETHFDANLLIGQKDKHFQQEDEQGSSFRRTHSHSQAVKDIKKSFLPSLTKKILEEKNASLKYTETKFSTPTGAIKPTTDRGLPREFANHPFFGSLTQAPSSAAGKGERDSLAFRQRKAQTVSPTASSQSNGPRVTSTPPPATPPLRQTTPPLRNTPAFPNHEQRRASAAPTTALPLTRDYGLVTREGHWNRLSPTEPPRLFRNDLSKVIAITSFGAFTTEPPLTTRYESSPLPLARATPLPLARATPTPSFISTTRVPPSPSPRSDHTRAPSFQDSVRPPNATQWFVGLQKTPGGFRYATAEAARVPERRPTSFGVQTTSGTDGSTGTGYSTGSGVASGSGLPTSSGGSTGTGFPTGADISTGKWFLTGSQVSTGTGVSSKAEVSSGGSLPTGLGVSFGSSFPSGSDISTDVNVPIGPDVSLEDKYPSGHGVSFEDLGSSPGEDEEDLNTVEVRIPDPRRMFFIPDNAAREAEMLNSTNETVLRISLPSARHHGPMRFKGVRGAKGRRPDCPQCHPAFLLPGSCQPCVLIRR